MGADPGAHVARVDCHTHLGESPTHVGGELLADLESAWGEPLWDVELEAHHALLRDVGKVVVLAFDAPLVGTVVPNDYVARYVRRDPERLIGFASVDPNRPDAVDRLRYAVTELGLRGLKIAPVYQGFHPHASASFDLVEAAADLRIPIIWHQGTTFVRTAPLEYGRPALLDAVARRFPDVPMWIAHLGHPWAEEAAATVRKHPNFYLDISAVHPRPWQYYQALVAAYEYGVIDRVLFGSDYPFATPAATARGLLGVNDIASGTALPRIPEGALHAILERDTLALLGIDRPSPPLPPTEPGDHP